MLIPKELIISAKEKFGKKAIPLIRDYFNLENFDEKDEKGSCPFGHSDSDPSFIFNPKDNAFHCFSCGRNFGIIDLYMQQGLTYLQAVQKLFEQVGTEYKFGERGVRARRNYKYPIVNCSIDRSDVEKYFISRKISKETLDYCNVGQDMEGAVVWRFFDENDVLLTVKIRPIRKPKKNEKLDKEWFLPNFDYTPILYNMNRVDYTNGPLVITEGQIDTLSVIESGYTNVVSVPGGTQNNKWIELCYDWLEKFDQIVIWSDSDKPGLDMRKEVCARLGQWRTKYVEIPEKYTQEHEDIKDANDILKYYGEQTVLDLIANAQEMPISGVTNMAEIENFDIKSAPGMVTGIKELDDILYKMVFGSVAVITGQRGAGKSSFVNQVFVCEALNQGYDVFIFSGELSAPVLKSWIDVTMIGAENIKMEDKFVHILEPVAKKKMEGWYNGRVMVYDEKKNNSADNILDKAISVTRKYGAKIWILDNLSVMDIGANDSNINVKQTEFMSKLIGLADLYNVLVVLIVHPRKLMTGVTEVENDDVAGSGAITNLAQYVMSVKRYSEKEKQGEKDGRGLWKKGKEPVNADVATRAMKNRFTGRIGITKLFFDYRSRRFFYNWEDLNKRYKWDADNPKSIYKYNPQDGDQPF